MSKQMSELDAAMMVARRTVPAQRPEPSFVVMDDIQTEPDTPEQRIRLREWYERTVPAHLGSPNENPDVSAHPHTTEH